ncbi:SAP30-binding protein isoform X2 [Rhinatrema bivittatum]|uniref:SAP30-binding protein isoform X2 n=1 Tax=Rhinatrema bivittatum TaxID=194408 RepID=UPI001127503E|nr:SAP30-binding protein isoform X2 [Rhinatrema bivittatum]
MAGNKNVLSSLAVYAEDSEQESDGEAVTTEEKGGLVSDAYGEDDVSKVEGDEGGDDEDEDDDDEDENSRQSEDEDSETEKPEAGDLKELSEVEKKDPQELVASFSERVRNMSPDEIKIPPEPTGRCSNHLQDKIQKLYERKMKEGMDMNMIIQRKKEFRNPSIYEKLIQFCSIDELGTNYPKLKPRKLKWINWRRLKRNEPRSSLLRVPRRAQQQILPLLRPPQAVHLLQTLRKGKANGTLPSLSPQ